MSRPEGGVRVRRTRKLLREALIDLIGEQGFDRITVGRLTERAMVSRAAFYRNYRDKYHLAEQIFDDAMATLLGTMADDPRPPDERWPGFFEHIAEYERLYGAMLGKQGGHWFAGKMRAALSEMSSAHLPVPAGDLTPTIIGALFVEAITWWLAHDRPMSPAEMAAYTTRLGRAIIDAELHGQSSEGHSKVLPGPSP